MSEQEVTQDAIKEEYDQAKANSPYIKIPDDGSAIEITVSSIVKTTEARYFLSKVDYAYEIKTSDDKKLSINSWALWKEIRTLIEESGSINGATLSIARPKKGKYTVKIVSEFKNAGETKPEKPPLKKKE